MNSRSSPTIVLVSVPGTLGGIDSILRRAGVRLVRLMSSSAPARRPDRLAQAARRLPETGHRARHEPGRRGSRGPTVASGWRPPSRNSRVLGGRTRNRTGPSEGRDPSGPSTSNRRHFGDRIVAPSDAYSASRLLSFRRRRSPARAHAAEPRAPSRRSSGLSARDASPPDGPSTSRSFSGGSPRRDEPLRPIEPSESVGSDDVLSAIPDRPLGGPW